MTTPRNRSVPSRASSPATPSRCGSLRAAPWRKELPTPAPAPCARSPSRRPLRSSLRSRMRKAGRFARPRRSQFRPAFRFSLRAKSGFGSPTGSVRSSCASGCPAESPRRKFRNANFEAPRWIRAAGSPRLCSATVSVSSRSSTRTSRPVRTSPATSANGDWPTANCSHASALRLQASRPPTGWSCSCPS